MKNLVINKTTNTLEVIFDINKKTLLLAGNSLPENPTEFYGIIDDYINNYTQNYQTHSLDIICDITYMNSSSNKRIFQLLKKCIAIFDKTNITWIYETNDDDMKEQGEDFEYSLGVDFNFQMKQ
jgi:hypothetical protein